MKRKVVFAITAGLIVLIVFSLLISQSLNSDKTDQETPKLPFLVGVEYAYGYNNESSQIQLNQLQALVDKVKDYTNLFVIGSLGITFDEAALTQACDYINNTSTLYFIILFTGLDQYRTYSITTWMSQAQQRYGERFLGIYRYDEPGGRTLDQGIDPLVYKADVSASATYVDVANMYVSNLKIFPNFYLQYSPRVYTADYGLYWFNYAAGYSAIFAEFVGNESRERHIALCRGAADAFNRDWGVIITWKYSYEEPYLENATELLADLHTAYGAGAKYAIVFSYPQITGEGYFGTLNQTHFDALASFWNYTRANPQNSTSSLRQAAYVIPESYGFGFRSPDDTIWGVFPPDDISAKIFNDVNNILPAKYGAYFDVLYDQSPLTPQLLSTYSKVYYWNQTIS